MFGIWPTRHAFFGSIQCRGHPVKAQKAEMIALFGHVCHLAQGTSIIFNQIIWSFGIFSLNFLRIHANRLAAHTNGGRGLEGYPGLRRLLSQDLSALSSSTWSLGRDLKGRGRSTLLPNPSVGVICTFQACLTFGLVRLVFHWSTQKELNEPFHACFSFGLDVEYLPFKQL